MFTSYTELKLMHFNGCPAITPTFNEDDQFVEALLKTEAVNCGADSCFCFSLFMFTSFK